MSTAEHWSEELAQFITFQLEGSCFGVPIEQVLRIEKFRPATRVPNAPPFLEGVTNVHGDIIPVLDLQKRLKVGPGVPHQEKARIIIVEAAGQKVGMIVDDVTGIERLPLAAIEPPPSMIADINGVFLAGIVHREEKMLILLDLARVLTLSELEELETLRTPPSTENE